MRECLICHVETVSTHNNVSDCLDALRNEIPRLQQKLEQLQAAQKKLAPNACGYCGGTGKGKMNGIEVGCIMCSKTGIRK